jgi:ribosomal protein S18 acetylase RimI-like enzyme
VENEAARAHRALEEVWSRLYGTVDGARFERRGNLLFALYPPFPIPQCNGPWVAEDTEAAAAGLAEAVAEVEAAGAWPWVQTRSGYELTQRAAAELGLTARESLPGMVVRPDELVSPPVDGVLAIDLIAPDEATGANAVLAASFGVPIEMLDAIATAFLSLDGVSCFVGRVDGEVVVTALGITIDDVTGVFNVATMPDHRGRGHGAALTARVVRDGFERGARLAFLQSSALGHRVYQRLGFRDVEEYILLSRPTAG